VDANACTNACTTPECGDGVVQAGEECDDGNALNTDACSNACTTPECGDGIVQAGEECDDGNAVNADACSNACTTPECGDGIVQSGEECDDGNGVNADVCSNACTTPECGDGIVQTGEQCDDGNVVPNDACTDLCHLPRCGDGILHPGEQCDDGNGIEGDGCTAACEPGELCLDQVDNDGDGFIDCDDPECGCINFQAICHHPCPSKIVLRPDRPTDILSIRAGIYPTQSFDPSTVSFGVTITNANGIIYSATLQPGDLKAAGRKYQFADAGVFTGGGIRNGLRLVRMSQRSDGLWRFSIRAFTDLSAATEAEMTMQVVIGNDAFQKTATWTPRGNGWSVNLRQVP
jgi:cysteine-rich repeat protein